MKTINEMYKEIGVSQEMIEALDLVSLSPNDYLRLKALFDEDIDLFYKEVKQRPDYRRVFLYLYLHFAYDLYPVYQERGISDMIYFDTFRDIVIWTLNCKRDYGEIGLDEYNWIKMHLKMKVFKLGRLQYEVVKGDEDMMLNRRLIKAGEMALNLHIPQGEPLSLEKCKASLQQAKEFFGDYKEITCQSWLLSPALQKLLPKNSNLVQFQGLFDLYDVDLDPREAEERIYHKLEDDPQKYEEKTTLQKAIKQHLLAGNKVGRGYGIIRL